MFISFRTLSGLLAGFKYALSSEERRAAPREQVVELQTEGRSRQAQSAKTRSVLVSGRGELSHVHQHNPPALRPLPTCQRHLPGHRNGGRHGVQEVLQDSGAAVQPAERGAQTGPQESPNP